MIGRRFIAAAICPQCGSMDTLYLASTPEKHTRQCTRCDFSDSITRGADSDDTTQAVKVLDIAANKSQPPHK